MLLLATVSGAKARAEDATSEKHFTGYSHNYADRFHGRRTASGQIHDKTKLTCAHRTLPFGTHLKVTNKRNGKSCIVVVNDRGPFTPSVCLDVSRAAAQELGFTGGKVPVECTIVDAKIAALWKAKRAEVAARGQREAGSESGKAMMDTLPSLVSKSKANAKNMAITNPKSGASDNSKDATNSKVEHTARTTPLSSPTGANAVKKSEPAKSLAANGAEATFLLVINGMMDNESQAHTESTSNALRGISSLGPLKSLDELGGDSKHDHGRIAQQGHSL